MSRSLPAKLNLTRVAFVGLFVPILLALIDRWLLSRELGPGREMASTQAMAWFVVQVGLLGVLCAKLIEPVWLRWVIYVWCLLLTDLNASSSLVPETSTALFTAQLGLVTVWCVLGTARWLIRGPILLLLLPVLLAHIAQTAALCLICFILRSQRFRLAVPDPATQPGAMAHEGTPAVRQIQFGIGDVLLWMTALAPLLAISRIQAGRMLTEGILHAIVLVVALWAALGEGSAWLRWPLLVLIAFLAGVVAAQVDWYTMQMFPSKPGGFSAARLQFLWNWQWSTVAAFFLAGGMLAATLLIYRTLGYRLCRHKQQR